MSADYISELKKQIKNAQNSIKKLKDEISKKNCNQTISQVTGDKPSINVRLEERRVLAGHAGKVNCIHWAGPFTDYSFQICSADDMGNIIIWDGLWGKQKKKISAAKTWLMCCTFETLENQFLACGGMEGKALIFKVNSKLGRREDQSKLATGPMAEFQGHSGNVTCCLFLDTKYLVSGSSDSSLMVWDLPEERSILTYNDHTNDVLSVAGYNENYNYVASGSSDTSARLWDIRIKHPLLRTFEGHDSGVNTVQFSSGRSQTIATGSEDSSIRLYDLRAYKELAIYKKENTYASINSIAFSRSGRLLFAGCDDRKIKVWDVLKEGDPILEIDAHTNVIKSVGISSDGYVLASGAHDNEVKLWF